MSPEDLSARAADLISGALVWDNHGCMPLDPPDTVHLEELERYRRAGWSMVSINAGYAGHTADQHLNALAGFRAWIADRPERYRLVATPADVEDARASGRLGVAFDVEGMGPLNGGRIDLVERFYELGVRWMLVAYNKATDAGAGCFDAEDHGLTAFGRKVLAEMQRVGMVACCSHTGARTALDVCEAADNPVILSHSNPRALRDHPRNVADALIDAVAATGGVIGLNGIGPFLAVNDASTELFVRHLDYVAGRVGPDHTALGLDYMFGPSEIETFLEAHPYVFPDWDGLPVQTIEPERLPQIVEALLRMGYTDDDLRKILGGNWLRVARAVWR